MLHIYTFYRSIYLYSMSYFFISISIIQQPIDTHKEPAHIDTIYSLY